MITNFLYYPIEYYPFTFENWRIIFGILTNEIYLSYASLIISIILTVYVYKLQKKEQEGYNAIISKTNSMINYQIKLNKFIFDIYAKNNLSFIHLIKSPLRIIDTSTKEIMDCVIQYLFGEIDSSECKHKISYRISVVQRELMRLNEFFNFYREFIDYSKYDFLRQGLTTHYLSHNIGPADFSTISDFEINNEYLPTLDIVLETLLDFHDIIIKDEEKLMELHVPR